MERNGLEGRGGRKRERQAGVTIGRRRRERVQASTNHDIISAVGVITLTSSPPPSLLLFTLISHPPPPPSVLSLVSSSLLPASLSSPPLLPLPLSSQSLSSPLSSLLFPPFYLDVLRPWIVAASTTPNFLHFSPSLPCDNGRLVYSDESSQWAEGLPLM